MNKNMGDGGQVEFSDQEFLPNSIPSSNFRASASASIDSYLDDFLKNPLTCTHTHTCNPPGPDSTHTHTCVHTHTQLFTPELDVARTDTPPKRSGNREAVRKYREKRKAHTVYLEEEVKKLRLENQQLNRKLQWQEILEAEASRLNGLLVDLRGKIDHELGVFPFTKLCNIVNTTFEEGDCSGGAVGFGCENGLPCFHPAVNPPPQAASIGGGGAVGFRCEYGLPCFHPAVDPPPQASSIGRSGGKVGVSWEGNYHASAEGCTPNSGETLVSQPHRYRKLNKIRS